MHCINRDIRYKPPSYFSLLKYITPTCMNTINNEIKHIFILCSTQDSIHNCRYRIYVFLEQSWSLKTLFDLLYFLPLSIISNYIYMWINKCIIQHALYCSLYVTFFSFDLLLTCICIIVLVKAVVGRKINFYNNCIYCT